MMNKKHRELLSDLKAPLIESINSPKSRQMIKFILEYIARSQDTNIQNELFKKLVLDYSKLAKQLEDKIKEVVCLSQIDPLTGIYNRLKFNESIKQQLELASRYDNIFSLIMFDIDYFKKINDKYGHDIGDRALQNIASITRSCLRKVDILSRWGGEEFMILAPQTVLKDACTIAQRVRKKIETHNVVDLPHLTISVGVTEYCKNDNIKLLIKRVDKLLYLAKESGRNQVKSGK